MKRWTTLLGLAAVLAAAIPAFALERGLYLVDGTHEYFFVDQTGSRHEVRDFEAVHNRWFSDMPVITTRMDVLQDLPAGEVITESAGPDMVVKKTTTTTTTTSSPEHLSSGVYSIDGGSDYYYIDDTGSRHLINDWDRVHSRWFSTTPVQHTRLELINTLPSGEVITESAGPDTVVHKRTTTTTEETIH